MQLARILQKIKSKCHTNAAFARLVWGFRGTIMKAGSPLSRAGTCKQKASSAMFRFYKN